MILVVFLMINKAASIVMSLSAGGGLSVGGGGCASGIPNNARAK